MYDSEISVVIPSLGGNELIETVEKLNSGTLIPNEILIVIPKSKKKRLLKLTIKTLKF